MKIAMMVRAFLQTPVPNDIAYSSATVAKALAEGLEACGHKVTFYGPEGTDLKVTEITTCGLRPLAKTQNELDDIVGVTDLFSDYRLSLNDAIMAKDMLTRAANNEFDLVVFHHFESVLPLCSLFPSVPVVHILHDFLDENRRAVIEQHQSPNQYFISISNNQRRDAPNLNYIDTVYNGINTDTFSFVNKAENYLFFSGRITPTKGVREAVDVAIKSRKRLLIAGSVSKADQWYFDEYVRPFLNDKILFLGMLGRPQLVKYYQKAAALLVPIQWQEPFGLTMAEANSCGTPVIAFRRGSVPEVISDGTNGYVVENSAEMIMAIQKVSKLKRENCRGYAETHFTESIMIDNYVKAFKKVLKYHQPSKPKKLKPKTQTNYITKFKSISKRLAMPVDGKKIATRYAGRKKPTKKSK